jgi:hypothetical protein
MKLQELNGEDWAGALFLDTWRHYAENNDGRTVKLNRAGTGLPVIGLLRLGNVAEGDIYLAKSLLETCPVFRHDFHVPSSLYGTGKVLVARLVAESYNQGAGGILVKSHPKARRFYERK